MEITYEITEEAYLTFNLYHVKYSKTIRKSLFLQRVLVPIFYLVVAVMLSFVLDVPLVFLVIPFLILGIIWAIFYPHYFYWHIRRSAKKLLREGQNKGVLGKHTMIFTEEGLREVNETGEETVSWTGIENIGEDAANFYLYNSGLTAFIVPKSGLRDVTEMRQFLLKNI